MINQSRQQSDLILRYVAPTILLTNAYVKNRERDKKWIYIYICFLLGLLSIDIMNYNDGTIPL